MNTGELIGEWRRQIKDTATPYLISDESALIFLNQAQNEAARRARLLVDSTTDGVARIAVTAADPIAALSPKVISIRRARMSAFSRMLAKRSVRQMDEQYPGWEFAASSRPFIVIVDYQSDALRLYPPPESADTLLLTVTREPLNDLVADADAPEIAARYHHGLIEWMKYRAYLVDDADLYDPTAADKALARFTAEFGESGGAVNERFEFEHYDDDGER